MKMLKTPTWRLLLGSLTLILFFSILFGQKPIVNDTAPRDTAILVATPQNTPMVPSFSLIKTNSEWTPQFWIFDDVEMTLVPPGCFNMGSKLSPNEQPINHVCVNTPFWIDRYEVTNKLYGSAGTFIGDDLPRETVTWVEARDFCEQRGARLPTEVEWEYSARGVDSLLYAWGNTFNSDAVTFWDNWGDVHRRTAPIGSHPIGKSWVGAFDMSGNIWEWVSSIYKPYPYDANDGREDLQDLNNERVMRGGSWYSDAAHLSSTIRGQLNPIAWYDLTGFRCVRDAIS
jgi:formylglycine-generating enzyme required for sulfatase activity